MTGEDVFSGGRVGRDDPRYPTLVRGFNLRWVGKPRYVELCGSAEQVRAAVQRALDDELRITVQGGGHCYENFAVGNDGGVILELSPMNAIFRDEETGWYCIEGGATLWDAYLGAGGGNFGVVTKYWFRDPPRAPEVAHLLSMAWNWDDLGESAFAALIGNYGAFLAANSDPHSAYSGLFALLHLFQRKAKQITLTVQYVGDRPQLLDDFAGEIGAGLPAATAQHVAHPVFGLPAPASDTVRCLPWLYATQTLNGIGANQRGKYKSAYMNAPFPDDQIAVMWEALGNPSHPNPQALLQVDSYGCQVNAVASDATAVPQRSSIMKLQYQTYWTAESDDDANLDWIRGFYDAMYGPDGPKPGPDGVMDGCYVNYPDVDLVGWQDLYYQAGYPKLQQVKVAWDPGDVFNHAQSVELPGSA